MKIVSEWCEHRDRFTASVGQGKNAEFVEDVRSIEDGGNNQSRLLSLIPWGKKAMTPKRSRVSGPSLQSVCEARESSMDAAKLVVARSKPMRTVGVPLPHQPIVIPHVVRYGGGEQFNRECVKVQSSEKVVDDIGLAAVIVDSVEDIAC